MCEMLGRESIAWMGVLVVVAACGDASVKQDAGSLAAAPSNGTDSSVAFDGGPVDATVPQVVGDSAIDSATCTPGQTCGFECVHESEAWCHLCGSLEADENCVCRPTACGAIEECDAPGPAAEGEYCGEQWWCDRPCADGLECVRLYPCDVPPDWRRACRKLGAEPTSCEGDAGSAEDASS